MNWLRKSPWLVPGSGVTCIFIAAVLSFSVAVNPFGANHLGFTTPGAPLQLHISNSFMIVAALIAGTPIVIRAFRALRAGAFSIDLLVSIAAIGALIMGEYWEAAAVTNLFAIGNALEAQTIDKTRAALAHLIDEAPETAIVLRDGKQEEVHASQVRLGETVIVKNGAKVPVDGTVVTGTGFIDEAPITGESLPVEKTSGDHVYAGSISRGGLLSVEANGIGADTTLARIIHRVEDAQDAKAQTQTFMEKFSAWYTPGIIVATIIVAIFTRNIELALTLLVISCPGALVISIPVAIVAGIGHGAKDGILIKGGDYLETSARVSVVAVDKTGTLTEGKAQLSDVLVFDSNWSRGDVLRWAAHAEAGSEHPLAHPIIQAAKEEGIEVLGLPTHTEIVAGRGVIATVEDKHVVIGNYELMVEEKVAMTVPVKPELTRISESGKTPLLFAVNGSLIALIAVADKIRLDAAPMVRDLHRVGVRKVVMLTGDNLRVAQAVGQQVGIDEVLAGLLPEGKLDAVRRLRENGEIVAMVGDGINDTPALAAADIGVAMGSAGVASAIETADIALMGDNLMKLPEAVRIAKRTTAVMGQNIAIALITVAVLLFGVFFGGVTMAIGMLAHEASVLLVVINALRLTKSRSPKRVSTISASTKSDIKMTLKT